MGLGLIHVVILVLGLVVGAVLYFANIGRRASGHVDVRTLVEADVKAQESVSPAMAKVIARKRSYSERGVIARAAGLGVYDAKSTQTKAQAEAAYTEGCPKSGRSDRLVKWLFIGVVVALIAGGVSLCQSQTTESDNACESLGGRTSLDGDTCSF